MSNAQPAEPSDCLIETVRERVRQIDLGVLALQRKIEIEQAIRSELEDILATLTRKTKPRKPRTTDYVAVLKPDTIAERHGIFASPSAGVISDMAPGEIREIP